MTKHIWQDTREQVRARDAALPKKPPKERTETQISASIKTWLTRLGAISIRVNSGVVTTAEGHRFHGAEPGTSDRINGLPVLLPPYGPVMVFVAIEVKRPGKKPTPAQQRFIDRVINMGGIALCVVSVDDAKRQLNAELRRRFGVSNEHEGTP